MSGLNRMCSRDLKVFLNYLSCEGESEVQYPWNTREWRALRNPRLFEDWARSLLMDKEEIGRFLVGSSQDFRRGIALGRPEQTDANRVSLSSLSI